MNKKIYKGLIAGITIFLAVFLFVGNYFYNVSLNTKISKEAVSNQDKDGRVDEKYDENLKWLEGKYTEIKTKSVVGRDIYGYEYLNPKGNGKWVIVVHGYTNHAHKMATFIRHFYEMGYNVFAPDLLGHGKSKNDFIAMGGFDAVDLANWARLLSEKHNNPDMYLFGVSMGAATIMNSLDQNLPANVKGFIADSGYISLKELFTYQLKKLYNLPAFPILDFASFVAKIRAGYFVGDVNATEDLKNTQLKGLILHGKDDTFVPAENARRAKELNANLDLHMFDDAKHVQSYYLYEDEYWEIVKEWIESTMF